MNDVLWIILASVLSPFLLYVLVRIITSATFRSWYEAKTNYDEKKEKK